MDFVVISALLILRSVFFVGRGWECKVDIFFPYFFLSFNKSFLSALCASAHALLLNLWPRNRWNLPSLLNNISQFYHLSFYSLLRLKFWLAVFFFPSPVNTPSAQNTIISKPFIVLRPLLGIGLMYYRPQSWADERGGGFGFSIGFVAVIAFDRTLPA